MHESLENIGHYMGAFAQETLEHGINILLPYISDPFLPLNSFTLGLGVTSIAHGAEILIKAAIAQEHPLLLFDYKNVGKPPSDDQLEIQHLFDRESLAFNQLPYALWAATGYKVANAGAYDSFRKLRNKIEHFCVPDDNPHGLLEDAVRFLFLVVDPILDRFFHNDVLTLVRPYGVDQLRSYLSSKSIATPAPLWLGMFNAITEAAEIREVRTIAERHRVRQRELSGRCSHYVINGMSLIIPVEHLETANRRSIRVEGNKANIKSFGIPLNPEGIGSPTHYGSHTAATEDIAIRFIRVMASLGGRFKITTILYGDKSESISSFDQHTEECGLRHIRPAVS